MEVLSGYIIMFGISFTSIEFHLVYNICLSFRLGKVIVQNPI